MRTNIVIDDQLMKAAIEATGLATKRRVVEAGLQLIVRLHAQERIRELRGRVDWVGDLEASRRFAETWAGEREEEHLGEIQRAAS